MFWIDNARYAKIWKIFQPKDSNAKYLDVSIGTSEKNQDGEYVNSDWPARVIGKAFNQISKGDFKEKDTVDIVKAKLSNERYVDKDGNHRNALRLLILELAPAGSAGSAAPTASAAPAPKAAAKPAQSVAKDDGDLPW